MRYSREYWGQEGLIQVFVSFNSEQGSVRYEIAAGLRDPFKLFQITPLENDQHQVSVLDNCSITSLTAIVIAYDDPILFISIDLTGTIMPSLLKACSLSLTIHFSAAHNLICMTLVICATIFTILAAIHQQLHISTSIGQFRL